MILKKIKTFKESEILEKESLTINESDKDGIIFNNKNNNINEIDEKNIINFKKIFDQEISNKIKYELQKDLINKQKKSYNMMILSGLKENNIELNDNKKKNKLTIINLENNKNQTIKEIEELLKGGIDSNKLKKLESKYNNNKEIINIINIYRTNKLNLEKGFNLSEEPLSDYKRIIKSDDNFITEHNNKYSNGNKKINNQSSFSFQNYSEMSPFYYISKGSNLSKNIINNNFNQEQIIQNKIKLFKDKMYKPFLDKIEKEKNIEYKRIQILKTINDPNIKNSLETLFGIERGKVDLELTKERDKINNAIKKYEYKLIINDCEKIKHLKSKREAID